MIPRKRFLVFGAGAIGTYIGGSLLMSGQDVTFLERDSAVKEIRERGLRLVIGGVENKIENVQVVSSIKQATAQHPFDLGILAVKSFDTQSVLKNLTEFNGIIPPILCLQNGVENEPLLRTTLGQENVISGTVTSAVGRVKVGEIILEKLRGIGISGENRLVADLIKIFNQAGLNAQFFKDEASMKWSKLLTNLLANASSAILNMLPRQIFSDPKLFQLEMRQLREAVKVMKALSFRLVDLPGTPVRLLALGAGLPYRISQPVMKDLLSKGRGDKKPSLLIDMQSGSLQSEVEFLNGAVVRFGEKLGIQTPVNRLLSEALVALVEGRLKKEDFDRQPNRLLEKLIS